MYFKQPRYYSEFKCIGTECNSNCCYGWRIDWSKDEIDKVINAPNCSPELKEIMKTCFVPKNADNADMYVVKLDDHSDCPCQTDEGLCMIQRELGEEYLSYTCTSYPRFCAFFDKNEGVAFRGCHLSCGEIVRKLINDEKSTELMSAPKKEIGKGRFSNVINEEIISEKPEMKYLTQIVEFFYELIGDKKCSLETGLILGALAAQKLTELVDGKEYDRIPEALKTFRKQVHNAAALKSIDSIRPNFNVSLGVTDKLVNRIADVKLTEMLKNEEGELDVERYLMGKVMLNEKMKDKSFWLRNIAMTLILELCVPFKSKKHTIFENYRFFVAAVACIKLNAIAATISPRDVNLKYMRHDFYCAGLEDKICVFTGIMSRRILQNKSTFDAVIDVLKEFGMNSPAYLALLVK